MRKLLRLYFIGGVFFFAPVSCFSQYILNGSATKDSCNCYTLTQPINNQSGSVWQDTKIDLSVSFDFTFKVFLGCDPVGADGIVFILQPDSKNIGLPGVGLGFQGISPSVGVSLDTYQNPGDPVYDNITIHQDGVVNHTNDLAGPVPASSTKNNIKDCSWHIFRIAWDASTRTLSTYFDGVFRLSVKKDIVTDIFKSDPMVYWGFSGATGGWINLQKFCTPLNPDVSTGIADNSVCIGNPIIFNDSSESFTTIQSYYWDFGDGTPASTAMNPSHLYANPGTYNVLHSITAKDGCTSPAITKLITIGDKPTVSFKIFDTCHALQPRIDLNTSVNFGVVNQWNWVLDGAPFSSQQYPNLSPPTAGNHSVQLTVGSNIGCKSNIYSGSFDVKPVPVIAIGANNGCVDMPIAFTGQQTDNVTTISNWLWSFGGNNTSDQKNTQFVFPAEGSYPVQLSAKATNGCTALMTGNIIVYAAHANAGNDTVALPNTSFQLHGSGGAQYTWWPATGLNNPYISNPMGNVSDDITYHLKVSTTEGCTDTASVKVIIFRGSAVYMPTAFTPNGDGLNDIIKPYFKGIKTLYYFTIYNRWGQKIFSTVNMNTGWDGYLNGNLQNGGSTYTWILKAVDIIGKVYNLKGSFVLLR